MKLLTLLLPLYLLAEDKAMLFFNEETINYRFNSSTDKIDYSSRLRFFKIDNFSSGVIIHYKFEPTKISEITQTTPDSLFYIKYKF
jgi:hypothetical protein